MKINCCLLLIALFGAQVFAQAPPQGQLELIPPPADQVVELVELVPVITFDHDESPRWIFLVFQTVSWCQEAAEVNQCAGSFRDIAICLAQSNTELEPACQQELMQAAMEHSDIEVLNLLVTRDLVGLQAPKQAPQEAPAMNEHTEDQSVQPIVKSLRETCDREFKSGICSFALDERVSPKNLLRCLVERKDYLSVPCMVNTRQQVMMLVEAQDPIRQACAALAWILLLASLFFCCMCICSTLARCCGFCCDPMAADEALLEEQYILAASTELSEEAELQMAMLLSKAEAEGKATALDQV